MVYVLQKGLITLKRIYRLPVNLVSDCISFIRGRYLKTLHNGVFLLVPPTHKYLAEVQTWHMILFSSYADYIHKRLYGSQLLVPLTIRARWRS